jgi:hypothetical protein
VFNKNTHNQTLLKGYSLKLEGDDLLAVNFDWQLSDIIDCPNKRIIILKIAKE